MPSSLYPPARAPMPSALKSPIGAAAEYVTAFERALRRAPAPVRHAAVADLEEELSWLDSRGTAMLLASLGTPQDAASEILSANLAAERLRRRRRIAAAVGVSILGATLTVGVLVLQSQASGPNRG